MTFPDDSALRAIRALFDRGDDQGVVRLARSSPVPWPAGVAFYAVAALINLEQSSMANRYLAAALPTADDEESADLTALEGLLAGLRGDAETYLRKTVEANSRHPTAHTLYHLGMALTKPDERLRMFQASFIEAEGANDRYAEARGANALASALTDAGRFKEALGWTRFALDRSEHPGLKLVALNQKALLEIYSGDTTELEPALQAAYDLSEGKASSRQRTLLRTTLADLYQATERYGEALDVYKDELRHAPRALRPWLVHGCVRALCALERQAEAVAEAEAITFVVRELSDYHRQIAALALGIALWPETEALAPLAAAYNYFKNADAVSATEAAFYLGALKLSDQLADEVEKTLASTTPLLTPAGAQLLAGRSLERHRDAVSARPPLQLFTLGKAEACLESKPVQVRRRSLELLTLLLSRPAGYEAEALSEGLYGAPQAAALRVELYRLRKELGVTIKPRPYRVTSPVWADLVELDVLLQQGKVHEAVALYRGPLLPMSEAPDIVELRNWLEAGLRGAVLSTGDTETIWQLAQSMPYDLEVWEALMQYLPREDPRRSVAAGKSARVRLELGV